MNDLERELRELFEERASNAAIGGEAPPRVLRKTRRRQASVVLGASLTAIAVIAGSITGVGALLRGSNGPTPATEVPAEPRTAVLPYVTITYPSNWYALTFPTVKGLGPVVQVTNFDPDFTRPCFTGDAVPLPPDGVVLAVDRGTGPVGQGAESWPKSLTYDPAPSACRQGGLEDYDPSKPEHLSASWSIDHGAVPFTADAMIGPDARQVDRSALEAALASLSFAEGIAPQTEPLSDPAWSPALVLDSATSALGPVILYLYEDQGAWIGVSGPAGSGMSGASQVPTEPPSGDEDVTMNLGPDGGVVWGDVSDRVARAELRTVEGRTFPATLVHLRGISAPGVQAVWGFITGSTSDRVTTLLFDDQGTPLNDVYPTGPRDVIATGTDPDGGPWTLYVDHSSEGDGLGFEWGNGAGGSGCCFGPLGDADLRLDGYGTSSGDPSDVTAFASTKIASVDLVTSHTPVGDGGETYHGELFPLPERYIGPAQVVLVIVPAGIPIRGTLIAYDAQGHEVARQPVGELPEPSGPTVEIDVVWHRLYRARDDLSLSANEDPRSLANIDPAAAAKTDPGVHWNDSPTPVARGVSIRGQGLVMDPSTGEVIGSHLVIVSATSSGDAYCIAIETLRDHGNNYRYGHVDAQSYDECRGGWR